ncbi:tyrosine-type recombinase/integrase [Selenomonas ruminantium]|uniref:tyrosine-type recombinase/integrase n=1 Tax=Selenomonas ruminantium TaxID=971 RepID=UPI0026EBB15D|nr:tyrosine-type recombinase/integrase [Selenomonas ruminantium]
MKSEWGEGTVVTHGNYYRAKVRYRGPNGEHLLYEKQAKTKKAANMLRKEFIAKLDPVTRQILPEMSVYFNDFSNRWLTLSSTALKETTAKYYKSLTKKANSIWGDQLIKDITPSDIQEGLNAMKGSARTRNAVRAMLLQIFESAVANHIISSNPVRATKAAHGAPNEKVALSVAELERLLTVAQSGSYSNAATNNIGAEFNRHMLAASVTLAAMTGMRRGEVYGLMDEDLELDGQAPIIRVRHNLLPNGHISSTKTIAGTRIVGVTRKTAECLNQWIAYRDAYAYNIGDKYARESNLVFTGIWGKHVSYSNLMRRSWKALCRASGVPKEFTFHGLRHTHITHLLAAGVDVKTVAARVGHTNPGYLLRTYAHTLDEQQKKLLNILEHIYN